MKGLKSRFLAVLMCVSALSLFAVPVVMAQAGAPAVATAPAATPAPAPVVTPAPAPVTPAPAIVPAPTAPTADQLPGLFTQIFQAAAAHNWMLLVGLVIMVIVFLFNVFVLPKEMNSNYLPWISVGVGVILQFAAVLIAGQGWGQAINMALITGSSGAGLWSLVGKHLMAHLLPKNQTADPAKA